MLAVTVNWTQVLIVGVPAYIAAFGAAIAAILSAKNRSSLSTPSGRSIGKQVESALHTGIANNMLLASKNGPTQNLDPETVSSENAPAPQVPAD